MDSQIDVKSGNSLNGTDRGDPMKKISVIVFFHRVSYIGIWWFENLNSQYEEK